MPNLKIVVIGDIILDEYIIGDATRISPEAPVPVVNVVKKFNTLGGASNVAANIKALNLGVSIYGVVGNDLPFQDVSKMLDDKGINVQYHISNEIPTTVKTRIIARNQQLMRIDKEAHFNHTDESLHSLLKNVETFDYIIVSDYAKGVCSTSYLGAIMAKKKGSARVLVDPKGKNWKKYRGAYLIKPNIIELEEIIGVKVKNDDGDVMRCAQILLKEYEFENILVTRGSHGMTLVNREGVMHYPTKTVEVYDVTGAGDTAMAVIAYGLYHEKTLDESIKLACKASTFVVTKPMTYSISETELKSL